MRLVRNRKRDTLSHPSASEDDWQDSSDDDQVIEEEPVEPDVLDADAEGDEAEGGDGNGDQASPGSKRGRLRWMLIGIGVAAVAVVMTLILARNDDKPKAGPPAPSPTLTFAPGERVPFQFDLTGVTATSYTGQNAPKAARRAGGLVRTLLSRFYDAGFANPDEWAQGPPSDIWGVFAKDVAARARTRVTALTLGKVGGMKSLEIDRTRLFVRILLDPFHRAVAAVATVSFDATGHLASGDLLAVSNHAQYFLRPIDGRWTIVGYPEARTTLKERPAPSPTPVPGPSGSASAPAAAPSSK